MGARVESLADLRHERRGEGLGLDGPGEQLEGGQGLLLGAVSREQRHQAGGEVAQRGELAGGKKRRGDVETGEGGVVKAPESEVGVAACAVGGLRSLQVAEAQRDAAFEAVRDRRGMGIVAVSIGREMRVEQLPGRAEPLELAQGVDAAGDGAEAKVRIDLLGCAVQVGRRLGKERQDLVRAARSASQVGELDSRAGETERVADSAIAAGGGGKEGLGLGGPALIDAE